jgi:hypothetical protein
MKTYYIIYKITNKINGKFYIGSHKTKNLDDNYMGSGKYLKYAQAKHGMHNFIKEILFVYDTPDEMYAKEAEIVNVDFVAEQNTYNLKLGGYGGFDHLNNSDYINPTHQQDHMTKMHHIGVEARARSIKELKEKRRQLYELAPSNCAHCNKMLPYRRRREKFCNRSCSASYNNARRVKK